MTCIPQPTPDLDLTALRAVAQAVVDADKAMGEARMKADEARRWNRAHPYGQRQVIDTVPYVRAHEAAWWQFRATYDPPTLTAMLDVVAAAQRHAWFAKTILYASGFEGGGGEAARDLSASLKHLAQVLNERSPDA